MPYYVEPCTTNNETAKQGQDYEFEKKKCQWLYYEACALAVRYKEA